MAGQTDRWMTELRCKPHDISSADAVKHNLPSNRDVSVQTGEHDARR